MATILLTIGLKIFTDPIVWALLYNDGFSEWSQNATIEKRVSLLEIQVVEIQEDVTDLDEDVTGLDQDVNFLFDEQVIQDARIFTLEQTSIEFSEEVDGYYYLLINECLESKEKWTCFEIFHISFQIYRTQLWHWTSE